MKKSVAFLVILTFLTGGLSQVYGQLEMKLVESGGESHALSEAHTRIGNHVNPLNHDVDPQDIVLPSLTVPTLNDSAYDNATSADRGFGSGVGVSESYAVVNFGGTHINSTFTTNPFIGLIPMHYQRSWVGPITNGLLNKADGRCYTAARYSAKLAPNNSATWGTSQPVPCKMDINLSMSSPVFGALAVSPYRDAIAYVRLNFGGSYWQATWLDDEGKWQISYKWRLTSNGSYATYNYKSNQNEDVVINQTTYEHVANNGDVTAELLVSTSPTTASVMLPGANNTNHVDQGVENYVGSGSGSGQIEHEYNGMIKLTPLVKVKTP